MATREFGGIISSTKWVDHDDETKAVQFDVSGISSATTRTLIIPDVSTTLVGTDNIQTLTNKTINHITNDIAANKLLLNGGILDLSGATPPTSGQVLTANSGTTATWQSPISGNVFGTEYYSYFNLNEQITNSDLFVVVANFSTNIVPSGTYRLFISYEWLYESDQTNRFMEVFTTHDNIQLDLVQHTIVRNKWFHYTENLSVVLSNDTHTFEVSIRTTNNQSAAHIRQLKMELWRIY